jgi:hypothetical protein
MSKYPKSFLPEGMDGTYSNGSYERDGTLENWQRNSGQTIRRSLERPENQRVTQTIRAVTPEPPDEEDGGETTRSRTPTAARGFDFESSHTSPRLIPGGEKPRERRQGLVFETTFDADNSSPARAENLNTILTPVGEGKSARPDDTDLGSSPLQSGTRPRTRTLDDSRRTTRQVSAVSKTRHRIGSVHSTSSAGFLDSPESGTSSMSFPALGPSRLQKSGSIKEKPGRRLLRKGSSRPTSPGLASPTPSITSLPVPVPTSDANKILKLMKILGGRMRGSVEYQTAYHTKWSSGIFYIDDARGSLLCEGVDRGPFYDTIVPDIRGCRVRPTMTLDREGKCLEIITCGGLTLRLLPVVAAEFDNWLAAFLCWQQVRPGGIQMKLSIPEMSEPPPELLTRTMSSKSAKDATIIKVGKLLLWDKGASQSSASAGRQHLKESTKSSMRSWRKVSCILQDNGEFKLLTENDVTILSVIQLSQLSRCAIQRLERSVLNEEYCIAIFPQYSSTSTAISIIRPVYIALESRVLFEVWFVLLRAFTIPEVYGNQPTYSDDGRSDITQESDTGGPSDMFRMEKSLAVRVTEAKVRKATKVEPTPHSKHHVKPEQDPVVGDYFAEVILDGEVRSRTMVKADTKNPFWREECQFQDLPTALPELSIVLKRRGVSEAISHGHRSSTSVSAHDQALEVVCGVVEVQLDQLEGGKDNETWWPIMGDNDEQIGEMFLKIRHEEIVVLMAKDYQPISELLHKFSSGLTVQVAQTVPSNLRYLSETFMNIFQVSGNSNAWLMSLVEDEIDGIGKEAPAKRFRFGSRHGSNDSFDSVGDREQSVRDWGKSLTGEANLLFRGNSLLTQALDFHMRRLGKEYLEEVLGDKINEINTLDPDCEVDPSRISHGQDITKNWAQLNALTTSMWNSIAASANRCPPALRQILKFIRAVAEDRYGDFLRTVPYTSVSGFLFLRFFCPAILNPKLFDLLRDHPRPKAQRTLTLIAKSLQVLANLSTFGQKEAWMEPMNKFLSSHRQSVKDFINNICSIPAERSTFALPASYSTPITILGRLTSTSREGFPSLPYLIDHARNFAALVKLWLESTASFVASHALEGDLLIFHELCLSLQERTDECLEKAQEADRNADLMSQQWEDMVSQFSSTSLKPLDPNMLPESEYSIPSYSSSFSQTPYLPSMTSRSSLDHPRTNNSAIPPSSSGSVETLETREKRERQSFWEATFGKDSKYQRPYESNQEDDHGIGPWTGAIASSPPSRGVSRNGPKSGSSGSGGTQKGFLSGLRKKGKDGKDKDGKEKDGKEKDGKEKDGKEKDGILTKDRERDNGRKASSVSLGLGLGLGLGISSEVMTVREREERREKEGSLKPGSSWNSGGA